MKVADNQMFAHMFLDGINERIHTYGNYYWHNVFSPVALKAEKKPWPPSSVVLQLQNGQSGSDVYILHSRKYYRR